MADDDKQSQWATWLQKQGITSVILVGVLAFFRQDVWIPVRSALENQTEILGDLKNVQLQIRDEQRRGVWRATEPPAPNELPKGVEPAKSP